MESKKKKKKNFIESAQIGGCQDRQPGNQMNEGCQKYKLSVMNKFWDITSSSVIIVTNNCIVHLQVAKRTDLKSCHHKSFNSVR